ncbi:MAG TPA: HAD family phosphatase [Acidobacteriaceae bacterium]|nr:HAD family phosphatase [Acidobacteriaceae bacterium]
MDSQANEPASHRSASGVDLVLFDYGQVLSTPPDPAAWSHMQTISHMNADKLHDAYWALRHDYDRGVFNGPDYWRAVAQHATISFDDAQINALLSADIDLWAQPNRPMIAWAARLQRAGVRTAILSNIGDAMAEGLTRRLAWLPSFERCIWSYELRMAKPEPAIFRAASELLRIELDRILFIDDKQENISAAQCLGMQAIRYADHATLERSMRDRGLDWLWHPRVAAAQIPPKQSPF